MNIVIFGINHAISRCLSNLHFDAGDRVFGVYNKDFSKSDGIFKYMTNDEFLQSDQVFDIIYIIAGYVPRGKYNEPNEKLTQVNETIPKIIVKKFSNARIIYLSSVSVYGSNNKFINEATLTSPENFYSKSKLAGENGILAHKNGSVLRIPSLYGEGIAANNFVNRAVVQGISDGNIVLFGSGNREQNYIHFKDVAGYLFALGKKKLTGIFLALGDRSYTNNEVAFLIQKELHKVVISKVGEDDSPSIQFENEISKSKLSYSARIDLTTGIKRIINHV